MLEQQLQQTIVAPLSDSRLFRVRGRDASRYLQGRLTQDIKSLRPGQSRPSMILAPQGRIFAFCTVTAEPDSFLIAADHLSSDTQQQEFVAALLQFKVADDVTLDLLEGYSLVSIQGPKAKLVADAFSDALSRTPHASGVLLTQNMRSASDGIDAWIKGADAHQALLKEAAKEIGDVRFGSESDLEGERIRAGILSFHKDISTTKVQVSDLDPARYVSFTKGCYAGQEVVEMSQARGRANRFFALFEGPSSAELDEGAKVPIASADPASAQPMEAEITSLARAADNESICFIALLKRGANSEAGISASNGTLRCVRAPL